MNHITQRFGVKPRDVTIGVLAGIALAVGIVVFKLGPAATTASQDQPLSVAAIAANAPIPDTPLSEKSSVDDVLALMLNSHTTWTSLNGQVTTVYSAKGYDRDNDVTIVEQIEIAQYGRARIFETVDGEAYRTWITNGDVIWDVNPQVHKYAASPFPEFAKDIHAGPSAAPPDGRPFTVGHPFGMLIPSPSGEYIFPTALAQGIPETAYSTQVEGMDKVAGREAVILSVDYAQPDGTLERRMKLWVDASTGIVLKYQLFSADIGWEEWTTQTGFDSISYESIAANASFTYEPQADEQEVPFGQLYQP